MDNSVNGLQNKLYHCMTVKALVYLCWSLCYKW